MIERSLVVDCFGGRVELRAGCPPARAESVDRLLEGIADRLRAVHSVLTRFEPGSELSRLNRDERITVPASPLMRRLARAVGYAGRLSGGLVDATCLPDLERAGYRESLTAAPPGPAAAPRARNGGHWALVADDRAARGVRRPPGVRIDSGGLAKGMAADLVSPVLAHLDAFVVDCAGDLRLGGAAHRRRVVQVRDPWGGAPAHTLSVGTGAVATSGVTARAWAGGHHLIDPRTGAPADTGVAQVTALAPTVLEAEVRAKAAVLAGPAGAPAFLAHGGVLIDSSGAVRPVGVAA